MADPSSSTVYLTMRREDHVLSTGSGVLYERDGRCFIATAWHNFSGRNSDTFAPLSRKCAVPDNVLVTVALVIEEIHSWFRVSITIPLQNNSCATYLIHPDPWPRKDVAVLPIDLDTAYPLVCALADGEKLSGSIKLRQSISGMNAEIQPIQACLGTFARAGSSPTAHLQAGDDLFVLGYPRGIADYSAAPIWKRATVASHPQSGWYRQPCFLIDCASRPGMSGAPVVLYSRSGNVRRGGMTYVGSGPSSALCGIYVGRLKDLGTSSGEQRNDMSELDFDQDDELFRAQLGRVWRTEVIDEIIDANKGAPHPDFITVPQSAVDRALADAWPREKSKDVRHLRLPAVRSNVVNDAIVALEANIEVSEIYRSYDAKVSALEVDHA